uniref:Uncharacterized protein n=1 Tax=Rhinolophus ferrumequinum TaxID=59479 RepID=A0A671F7H9_RHIFE
IKSHLFHTGGFYYSDKYIKLGLRRCENKNGYCKKNCRNGEFQKYFPTWQCDKNKMCCVPEADIKPLSSSNKISMTTIKKQQLLTTKKLKTIVMVTTASIV